MSAVYDGDVDLIVVDDNPAILENVALLFEGVFTVATFETPGAAIAFLKCHRARVLITDLRMPEMNGLMLIVEARRRCPSIRPILLSAFIDTESVTDRRLTRQFTTHLLPKPYSIDAMVAMVDGLMG